MNAPVEPLVTTNAVWSNAGILHIGYFERKVVPRTAGVTVAEMAVVHIIVLKIAVDTTFVKRDAAGFTAVMKAAVM